MREVLRLILLLVALGAPARPLGAVPPSPDSGKAKTTERRIYFSMWTVHLLNREDRLQNNSLIAVSWDWAYAATFINSFDERSYSAGIQETVARREFGLVSLAAGYRIGLITGYDERLFRLAGEVPVLPLLQPLVTLQADRLGIELSYSGVVASAALLFRL